MLLACSPAIAAESSKQGPPNILFIMADDKLIFFHRLNQWELFDLAKDPHELNNVYTQPAYARTVKRLKSELARLRKQLQDHDEYVDGPPN